MLRMRMRFGWPREEGVRVRARLRDVRLLRD